MADESAPRRAKRRLRPSSETMRERALKTQVASNEPTRPRRRGFIGRLLAWPFLQIIKLFRYQPFKFIAVVVRFMGRILIPKYFRNSGRELRYVRWPNWRESRQLTFAVLAFAIVFGALIAVVDYGLDKVFKEVLLK